MNWANLAILAIMGLGFMAFFGLMIKHEIEANRRRKIRDEEFKTELAQDMEIARTRARMIHEAQMALLRKAHKQLGDDKPWMDNKQP